MKIGILTHYNIANNGAVLQMYSLNKWLKDHGYETYILTYQKNFDFSRIDDKKYNIKFCNLPFIINQYFFKKSPKLFFYKTFKQILFNRFFKNNFQTKKYDEFIDCIIVGSDEVFSLQVGCNKMMYGYGLNTNELISYAPSFGQTDLERINEYNCNDLISKGLFKFDFLSVRDEESRKIVNALTGFNPTIVCDPVILAGTDYITQKVKLPKKRYILLYSYDKNMNEQIEIQSIKHFAKENNLLIYSIGCYHSWCDKNIICNPLKWVEFFRNAEVIITDTFHGAVVSIVNLKKSFFIIRDINSNKLKFLINQFELNDFIIDTMSENILNSKFKIPYNKEKIKEKIIKYRSLSENYILSALKNE